MPLPKLRMHAVFTNLAIKDCQDTFYQLIPVGKSYFKCGYFSGGDTLYGVLDGHDGLHVAEFTRSILITELCKGLRSTLNPKKIPAMIQSCILGIDKKLHQQLRPLLEERALIKLKLAEVSY